MLEELALMLPASMTPPHPEDQARELLDSMQEMYGQLHAFRAVDSKNFRNVSQTFYRRSQAQLEKLGFEYLIDIEDATVNAQNDSKSRTFIRVMLSADRTITAAIYHFPLPWFVRLLQFLRLYPQGGFTVDFEAEFSDGTFLVTSNTLEIDRTIEIPGIQRQQLPARTGIERSFALHQERLIHIQSGDVAPQTVSNWAEVEAAQHRLQAVKNGHREQVGYTTAEEIDRIADGRYGPAAGVLKDEIEKLQNRDETKSRA